MTSTIKFADITVTEEGSLRCSVVRDDSTDELWFELPGDCRPKPDLIASALSTLCGTTYDQIHMDLPIGPNLSARLEKATKARLHAVAGSDIARPPGDNRALNFSGGYDSIAAYAIAPDSVLVSLDFGGRFSREREMFDRYDTHVISTNLVDLKLNRNHWSFMAIGTILTRDYLNIGTYSFGSIQAGSLPHLLTAPRDQRQNTLPTAIDMQVSNPVAGISEVGAIMTTVQATPDLLIDILQSVAHPGEMKYQRKHFMLEAACNRMEHNIDLPEPPGVKKPQKWGSSFADDLSSLYIIKQLGSDAVHPTYSEGIPESVVEWVAQHDLSFMERFNPHAYEGLNKVSRADYYQKLVSYGITPFEKADWQTAEAAVEILNSTASYGTP